MARLDTTGRWGRTAQVGAVSYTMELPRGIYPELQYVYDLELPEVGPGTCDASPPSSARALTSARAALNPPAGVGTDIHPDAAGRGGGRLLSVDGGGGLSALLSGVRTTTCAPHPSCPWQRCERARPQTIEHMQRREFKPNCALVLIDFFVRWGLLDPATEPDFVALVQGCHATHPFAR